jgi:hypothetical protein
VIIDYLNEAAPNEAEKLTTEKNLATLKQASMRPLGERKNSKVSGGKHKINDCFNEASPEELEKLRVLVRFRYTIGFNEAAPIWSG